MLHIDWNTLFSRFTEEIPHKNDQESLAWAFHEAVARAAIRMVEHGLEQTTTRNIVLSGGVFMNRILTELLTTKLQTLNLNVHIHRNVPPNDGGVALGQAVIAGYAI